MARQSSPCLSWSHIHPQLRTPLSLVTALPTPRHLCRPSRGRMTSRSHNRKPSPGLRRSGNGSSNHLSRNCTPTSSPRAQRAGRPQSPRFARGEPRSAVGRKAAALPSSRMPRSRAMQNTAPCLWGDSERTAAILAQAALRRQPSRPRRRVGSCDTTLALASLSEHPRHTNTKMSLLIAHSICTVPLSICHFRLCGRWVTNLLVPLM